jgi:DNA helicase II / ATP-dependent DNA helicase PcrA
MNPSVEQVRAITLADPTILAVASPGSGKTTTLVARLREVIHNGADPAGIVAITFTTAAATELQTRLNSYPDRPTKPLGYCGTLHGYMLSLLRSAGHKLGLKNKLSVLDEEQTESLLNQCLEEMRYKGTLVAIQTAIDRGPADLAGKQKLAPAEVVARHFYWTLRQNGLLTFDCLLWYGLELLRKGWAPIDGVTHLFVDEYQDSGPLDDLIYRHMGSVQRFFVGDPDQSVFAFRGATLENILNMAGESETKVVTLESNFRSDRTICEAAQRLIEHNAGRYAKRTASVSAQPGEIVVRRLHDQHAELVWIANVVESSDDCAVLLRTNHLVGEVTKYLIGLGIPVAAKKRQERPEDWQKAKLLLALLNDPANDLAAYWFTEMVHGTKKANEVKLRAAAAGRSINEFGLKIPRNVPVEAIDEILGKAGISDRSREAIAKARIGLPAGFSMADLLLTLAQEEEVAHEQGHGATVTTMHAAKGREWDTVILPAFEEEILIGRKENGNVEEERRLAYVSFTRARHRLLISWCERRKSAWGFKPEPATPCRFIAEAGL